MGFGIGKRWSILGVHESQVRKLGTQDSVIDYSTLYFVRSRVEITLTSILAPNCILEFHFVVDLHFTD